VCQRAGKVFLEYLNPGQSPGERRWRAPARSAAIGRQRFVASDNISIGSDERRRDKRLPSGRI